MKRFVNKGLFILTGLLAIALLPAYLAAQEDIQPTGVRSPSQVATITTPNFMPTSPGIRSEVAAPRHYEMSAEDYARKKAEAASQSSAARPSASGAVLPEAVQPITDFDGLNQNNSDDSGFIFTPPDTHGAIGRGPAGSGGQFVEVVNNHFAVYQQICIIFFCFWDQVKSVQLSTFLNYPHPPGALLTDPRVVYDRDFDRFVVTAVGRNESPTVQFFFLAVSQTADATGPFFVYQYNMPLNPGDFYDYPQLGIDRIGLLFTFNVFNACGGPCYAELDVADKASAYAGVAPFLPFFTNLHPGSCSSGAGCTLAPPVVLDGNLVDSLVVAQPGGLFFSSVLLYKATTVPASLTAPSTILVPVFSTPRNAHQPGTAIRLDSLDGRFQNSGRQLGNTLFQVNSAEFGPAAAVHYMAFDTNALTESEDIYLFTSGTSDDFNPSIAANDVADLVLTWSSTDEPANLNAAVMVANRPPGGLFSAPFQIIRSGTALTGEFANFACGTEICARWGDYSAASLDPLDAAQKTFWAVNEYIGASNQWNSRIAQVLSAP